MLSAIGPTLRLLSAAVLGVSAGGMLTGALILLPFWQESAPADFLAWFAANAARMLWFFGPLQTAGALLAVAAAIASFFDGSPARMATVVAAALAVAVLIPFFLFFQQANAGFAAATIPLEDIPAQLARYEMWQWVRVTTGIAAFGAALLSMK